MSKTYRRKNYIPYWVLTEWYRVGRYCPYYRFPMTDKKKIKETLAKYHSDAQDIMKEPGPKWFKKLYEIRPRRRKEKALCNKVLKLVDYEDAPEFPLFNKPKEYYW